MRTVSVIVPVYNAEATLVSLVDATLSVLDAIADESEMILVNDGSADSSWELICDLAERHRQVQGINLMRNFGQHNALLCGVRAARYHIIVTMDDDFQNPPEEIPKLVDALCREDLDVIYGYPIRQQHSLGRDLASAMTKIAMQKGMGVDAARYVSAFRAFRTELREAFSGYDNSYVSIDVLLTWGTTRFGVVRVRHDPRKAGTTGYTLNKLMTHAVNMLTGFTTWPLRIASFVGFAFTVFGLAVLMYVVGRYLLTGGSVPGFPFLASIIALFSGATLFSLGIIGEYLARMYFRNQGRPSSVVRETTREKVSRATDVNARPEGRR
jgi:undecaprenyl-phosphate 4-deoxy-4-formamido-L-arabinose transferase